MSDDKLHIDWELAARILSGESDEIDRGLFEQWLNSDEANREEWKNIQNTWNKANDALLIENIDTSSAWNRVHRFTVDDEPVEKKRYRYISHPGIFSVIAASVILVLGLGWILLAPFQQSKSSLIVSNSDHEEMVLSDGSSVILNSGSKFTCEQPFDENERMVKLTGEGFFKVEGNREWPFMIHTGDVVIRVTGTSFNVRAYPNLDITEVAVTDGRVEVLPFASGDLVVVNKGQTALFEKSSGELTVKSSTDPNLLAWITRKINFNETPLNDVAETLERVYNVNIQMSDSTMANERLTARFSENSLDFVLQVVCTTFNLEMQREGETIFLSETTKQE